MAWLFFVFFNDTATTEIYTRSLHDALPIFARRADRDRLAVGHDRDLVAEALGLLDVVGAHEDRDALGAQLVDQGPQLLANLDRKSTRLNSSHANISYAVFCLKKKNN